MMIPPDPDSLAQSIKRVHFQVYTWIRSHETHIDSLRYQEFGWEWSEERKLVWPVWFVGLQIPPEIKRSRRNHVDDAGDADDERDDARVRNRKRKCCTKGKGKKAKKQNVGCEEASSVYDKFDETMNEDDDTFDEEDEEMREMLLSSGESDWEVSDFLSSSDSEEDWSL